MPQSREKHFLRNCAFLLYDLFGHALAQEPPAPEVLKFTIYTLYLISHSHAP